MHYEVLDSKRKTLLPLLRSFKERFYLAGGTGLALQISHRTSVDFDFFTQTPIDTERLIEECARLFVSQELKVTLEENDSLNIILAGAVKISFLRYSYPLLKPCTEDENIRVASVEDIGCMKLSAVVSRATEKDFVDLYFILQQVPLTLLLEDVAKKMPILDRNLVLKSLVYFDDVEQGGVMFRSGFEVPFSEIKKSLERQVRQLSLVSY